MTVQPEKSAIVLVVEDEPLQRMMAIDLVEDLGFEAVDAADADQAIGILETRPDIRVVFTDIDMPGGVDGMKLAASIRDRWPPIEIIIVSGKRKLEALTLPVRSVFFPKPYRRQEVAAALSKMVA